MSWSDYLKTVVSAIFSRLEHDIPRLVESWRTLAGLLFLSFLLGFYYARRMAGASHQFWRLSNFALRQKTVELTSRLRHYAAGREREMRLAWKRGSVDPGEVTINLKADYDGSFRVDAINLRHALEARLTRAERLARAEKAPVINRLYEEPESHTDLVAVGNDLDEMAHRLPRRRGLIAWFRAVFVP